MVKYSGKQGLLLLWLPTEPTAEFRWIMLSVPYESSEIHLLFGEK